MQHIDARSKCTTMWKSPATLKPRDRCICVDRLKSTTTTGSKLGPGKSELPLKETARKLPKKTGSSSRSASTDSCESTEKRCLTISCSSQEQENRCPVHLLF